MQLPLSDPRNTHLLSHASRLVLQCAFSFVKAVLWFIVKNRQDKRRRVVGGCGLVEFMAELQLV